MQAMANEAKPRKCVTLRCTRSPTPYQAAYLINNQPLHAVDQIYLVKLHSSMTCNSLYMMGPWSHHIQAIVNKATKMLNFVEDLVLM